MKKLFYLLMILACLIGITSCNNLLNGSDLIQKLDAVLDEVNAPEVETLISSNGTFGTTAPNGRYLYKINKKYPLMLQLNSDDYVFKKWEAVNSQGVPYTDVVTFESADELDTYFTINRIVSDLWIRPCCVQYPAVKKALPENKTSGNLCYSPIELTFNIPIVKDGLLNTFDNISIKVDGKSVTSYFNLPMFSEDGTVLTIKPKSSITELVKNISFCDIQITINSIKSAENPELMLDTYSYTYRINNATDTTSPAIKNLIVAKDKDKINTIAANADYNSWQTSDIEYNHIGDTLWISCDAIDADSGIDSLIITETIVNNTDGTPRNQTLPEVVASTEFKIVNSEEYSIENLEYKLSAGVNSLVKLNIKVKDRAGFYSSNDDYNYYVVAEPVFINLAELKFNITNPNDEDALENYLRFTNDDGLDVQKLSKIKNIKHNYYKDCYSKINVQVNYWNGKEEPANKNKLFSISNYITNEDELVLDGLNNEFSRNPNEITTVEMVLTDEIGHSYVQLYKIPCSSNFLQINTEDNNLEYSYGDVFDSYYDETLYYSYYYQINEEEWKSVIKYSGINSYYFFGDELINWFEENEETSCNLKLALSTGCYDENKNNHTYGCIDIIAHFECNLVNEDEIAYTRIYDGKTGTPEVIFPKTVNVKKDFYPEDGLIGFTLSYPQDFIPTENVTYVPYYKSLWFYDGEDEYIPSMSCFIEPSELNIFYLSIAAFDSRTGERISYKNYGERIDNDDGWEDLIDDTFVILDARDNIAKPQFEAEQSRKGYEQLKPNTCILGIMNTGKKDANDTKHYISFKSNGTGIPASKLEYGEKKNNHQTVKLDYCYLENSITNYGVIRPYTSALNLNFENRIYVEMPDFKNTNATDTKRDEKFITKIPYNSAGNSFYTMYGRIYDTNGTNTVKELGVVSNYVYDSLPVVENSTDGKFKIKIEKSKIDSGCDIKLSVFEITDTNYWLENINHTVKSSNYFGFSNTTVANTNFEKQTLYYDIENTATTFNIIIKNNANTSSYKLIDENYMRFYVYSEPTNGENKEFMHKFLKTVYIYPRYYKENLTCNKKNFFEGANGIQFFIDQPTLVQTLYCNGDLGNDADVWATKAMEADVRVLDPNGDCRYSPVTDDEHLPSGNYYCIVAHFADGTSCMSDVKYKK